MERPEPETISLADYLLWEERQAERYEWSDGAVIELDGVTDEHSVIETNLAT